MASAGEASRIGKRGAFVIPSRLRRRFGIGEGSFVIAEAAKGGILLRPAAVTPLEIYSPERKASFLLTNAVGAEEYIAARKEVRGMSLDASKIPHRKPR